MAISSLLRPWSGRAYRHIPAGSPYDVLDFRLAGLAADNRWNRQGEPTVYLASDRAVALAEFARHLEQDRSPAISRGTIARAVFRLHVSVDALFNLCERAGRQALSLQGAPVCFLDKAIARAVAEFLRRTTSAQALRAPSVAFLDNPDRWILVLFLEKLPADPRQFVTAVEAVGNFQVGIAESGA
ncbi:MAG: RES family NAD+ phosphorylase [Chloroflexi bacterium]|nr:RES family NAD+ phosphorylase [Chloroflexota bacterium]